MFPVNSTNEEQVRIGIAPQTRGGQPARIEGLPTVEVTEGDATFELSEDGTELVLKSGSANTVNRVKVTADADLGEGVQNITEEIIYTVTEAGAVGFGFTAAAPELKA